MSIAIIQLSLIISNTKHRPDNQLEKLFTITCLLILLTGAGISIYEYNEVAEVQRYHYLLVPATFFMTSILVCIDTGEIAGRHKPLVSISAQKYDNE